MPYYNAGDYYGRGDYYQAGGLFSFIGKGLHALGGLVRKALPFVPGIGPVLSTALDVRNALQARGVPLPPAETGLGLIGPGGSALAPLVQGLAGPPMIAPPAPGGIITTSPMGTPVSPAGIAMQVARMRHTHPNKSTYVTRGGGTSHWPQQLIVHPKHTELVPSRRMNVANPRTLRRALRRAAGFVKHARRAHVKLASFHGRGGKKRRK